MPATSQKTRKADSEKRGRGGKQTEGKKRPFLMEQVQLIRANLTATKDYMQLALLETAISTCLRSSDLLAIEWKTIAGVDRWDVRQKKTGEMVTVTLSRKAQDALAAWMAAGGGDSLRLFPLGREQYARIVKEWARMAHCNPKDFSTHSLRRCQASHLYKMTGNLKAASILLGHKSLSHTSGYLGVETEDALKLKAEFEL